MGFNVYTVGKSDGPSRHPKHLELDFKRSHGFTRVLRPVIAALKHSNMRVLVCLEHPFMQFNYYRDKYGTNWLSHKCLALVKIGVDEIFLPRDNSGEMDKMITDFNNMDPCTSFALNTDVEDKANPLFTATQNYCTTLVGKERMQTESHCNRYTKEGSRYIHITSTISASGVTTTRHVQQKSDAARSDFEQGEDEHVDVHFAGILGPCNTMMVNVGIKDLCPGDVITQLIMNKQKQVKYLPLAFANQVDPNVWIALREIFTKKPQHAGRIRCAIRLQKEYITPQSHPQSFLAAWGWGKIGNQDDRSQLAGSASGTLRETSLNSSNFYSSSTSSSSFASFASTSCSASSSPAVTSTSPFSLSSASTFPTISPANIPNPQTEYVGFRITHVKVFQNFVVSGDGQRLQGMPKRLRWSYAYETAKIVCAIFTGVSVHVGY